MTTLNELASLEREYKRHSDAEIKNIERLQTVRHRHTAAMCKTIEALIKIFNDRKIYIIVEAEISSLGKRARPEDFVAWIENIGVFVIEVKSHRIDGIRSFENNVPQIIYEGQQTGDVDLLDQPKDFAYKLKGELEKLFDEIDKEFLPVYFAGWLPNVSPEDIASKSAIVSPDKVWLSDMLERNVFEKRLSAMKNITRGTATDRSTLEIFCKLFGSTSGLKQTQTQVSYEIGSLGHLIDRKNQQLKRLTKEQESLAFSPNLVKGPKVIRGVAGSGKTIVLANAVAELFIRERVDATSLSILHKNTTHKILVLCYNRTLVSYLKDLIKSCFNSRKPESDWTFPNLSLTVINIDRYAYNLSGKDTAERKNNYTYDISKTVNNILNRDVDNKEKYRYVFIDEGQDIDTAWYPLIRYITADSVDSGKSIIVFYDDAQNIYGQKRPGQGGVPPWKDFLGTTPNPRGLTTKMRVGHRNTNQVLSFSFSLLLGSFSEDDPQMVEFSSISEFINETIPSDPSMDHPHAGQPCVERIDDTNQFKVNFSVYDGPLPGVRICINEDNILESLVAEIKKTIDPSKGNVSRSDVLIMAPFLEQVKLISDRLNSEGITTHNPVKFPPSLGGEDKRDSNVFQENKVTVSTIKSAKGYTAHVCHLVYVNSFEKEEMSKEERQEARAQIHVACTRSSLCLTLWGTQSPLMNEARRTLESLQ